MPCGVGAAIAHRSCAAEPIVQCRHALGIESRPNPRAEPQRCAAVEPRRVTVVSRRAEPTSRSCRPSGTKRAHTAARTTLNSSTTKSRVEEGAGGDPSARKAAGRRGIDARDGSPRWRIRSAAATMTPLPRDEIRDCAPRKAAEPHGRAGLHPVPCAVENPSVDRARSGGAPISRRTRRARHQMAVSQLPPIDGLHDICEIFGAKGQ